MGFKKNIITKKGLSLHAKLIKKECSLEISKIVGGTGFQNEPYDEILSVCEPIIEFEVLSEISRDESRITIPLYYSNEDFEGGQLTHIGIYAIDPDEGEILYSVCPSFKEAMPIPAHFEGRLELTVDVIIELSNELQVNILVLSKVYLTKPEADTLYSFKKHIHAAAQVDETTGETTEVAQRRQDADIEMLKKKSDSGTTSAITIKVNTIPYDKWKVVNHCGIYDLTRKIYYA